MSILSLNLRGKAREKTEENRLEDSALGRLARTTFRQVTPPQYSRKEPIQPLLKSTPDDERQTVIKVWRVMTQFTQDMAKYSPDQQHGTNNLGSVMGRLRKQFEHKTKENEVTLVIESAFVKDDFEIMKVSTNKSTSSKLQNMRATLTRRLFPNRNQELSESLPLEYFLFTPLDQVHYIAGCGILKPQIRDEIYCQVCKHVTRNPNKTGTARGWLLLGLLITCFPPSTQILENIFDFIEEGPENISYLKTLLKGSLKNGPRFQPPSFLELESALLKKSIDLQVTLMDGTVQTVRADGTTTSRDLCYRLCESLGLRQKFGYSLYISLRDKVASLGAGSDHVMDAISQCEQMFHEQDGGDGHAPWRLFYRKEIFAPWDDFSTDMMAVCLLFAQVTRGVMLGEYNCESDADLVVLAARQYYIEYGSDISEEGLHAMLPSYIPPERRKDDDSLKTWRRQVMKKHNKLFNSTHGEKPSIEQVKSDIVHSAKTRWPMSFSRYYDVIKLEGPHWDNNNFVNLAINSTGIYIMSPEKRTLLEISFPEIITIRGESSTMGAHGDDDDILLFVLADGSFIKFKSTDAADIRHIVSYVIGGLRMRSTWAVVRDVSADCVSESCIDLRDCDLIHLAKPAAKGALKQVICEGTNCRTGQSVNIPTKSLYVIPVMSKPSEEVLKSFRGPKARFNFGDFLDVITPSTAIGPGISNGHAIGRSSPTSSQSAFNDITQQSPVTYIVSTNQESSAGIRL